jgi:hypothetical protein
MDRLNLYYGDSLKPIDKLEIKHPKLIDIKNLGYEKYQNYINLLTLIPRDIADILWFESNIWYEDISNWMFFLEIFQTNPMVSEALEWFLGIKFTIAKENKENPIYYLINEEYKIVINEIVFGCICEYIRQINFLPSKSDLELAGNKKTKIYLLQQQQKKRKRNKKEKIDLASIVSSLDWKSSKGNEIWDFPIYRIFEGYFRLSQIDNYEKTMLGLYFGSIDTKKNPIDFEKINWSNIITI